MTSRWVCFLNKDNSFHDSRPVTSFVRLQSPQVAETAYCSLKSHSHHLNIFHFTNLYMSQAVCPYHLPLPALSCLTGVGMLVRARVLNCVDGVNIALLQKAINVQRSFFKEREDRRDDAAESVHAT